MNKHTPIPASSAPRAIAFVALGLALITGCTAEKKADATPPAPAPEVVLAEKLLDAGRLQDATIAAVDIARKKPEALGLVDLQYRIAQKLAEERAAAAVKRAETTLKASTADAKAFGAIPDMYRTRKHVIGEVGAVRTDLTRMQAMLTNSVTINLPSADLDAIIAQIGETQGINMIADSGLGIDPDTGDPMLVTIYAEDTPLIEILDYIGRNFGVTFSVGNNLVWIFANENPKKAWDNGEPAGPPFETRVYRLRKGMVGSELGKSVMGGTPFAGVQSSNRQNNQQQQQQPQQQEEGSIGLLESIERFVPQPEGSDFLFNDKAHVLIVKNTRENLALAENIIEALDVRPLQVLIEARFITTTVNDLRELGIDWLLDNRKYSNRHNESPPRPGYPYPTDPTERMNWYQNEYREYYRNLPKSQLNNDWYSRLANPAEASGPNALPNNLQFTRYALAAATGGTGSDLAYQFVLGNTALQATLHALQQTGNSKTIVVPRVTTLNNREANFRVGEDTTYFDDVTTQISSTTGYGNSNSRDSTFNYNRPSTVETGYSLIVTPSVGHDHATINLVLRPEISSIKEWQEYIISTTTFSDPNSDGPPKAPTIRIPTLSRKYIETEAVIRSGETIVLGGLVNTLQQEDTKGTPWISRIPLIGYLFKKETKQETYENILIFVTATVLSDIGEELIPLQDFERYGLEVPADASIPNILKDTPIEEAAGEEEVVEAVPDTAVQSDAGIPAQPADTAAPVAPAVPEAAAEVVAPVVEAAAPAAPAPAPAVPAPLFAAPAAEAPAVP